MASASTSQNVFYPALNEFCQKYFVVGQNPLTPRDIQLLPACSGEQEAALFEHLLLFDTVSFKVHGDNIPLLFLLQRLGVKRLEELIEQGAIRFILWNLAIVHPVDNLRGVNGIAHLRLTSPAHCDPDASIDCAFDRLTKKPSDRLRKLLKRKVAPLYSVPPLDLAPKAVELAVSAFSTGKLRPLGLHPDKRPLDDLTLAERQLLSKGANELLEYSYLLSGGMTAFSNFEYFSFFTDSVERIANASRLTSGFSDIAKFEDFPDLETLYPMLDAGLAQVPRLRSKRESKQFRKWLATATTGDTAISREYLDAIRNAKGSLATKSAKFTKSIVMTAIGATVGAAVDQSPMGAGLGGAIGAAAEPVVHLGLDLLDEFVLDGLRKGWNPRMFFDDLRMLKHPDLRTRHDSSG